MKRLNRTFSDSEVIQIERADQVPVDTIYKYRIEHCVGEKSFKETDEEIASKFIGKYIRIFK